MSKLKPPIINLYLIRIFLKRFTYVLLSMSVLIFIINCSEVLKNTKESDLITGWEIAFMGFLKIPTFLADVSIFVILLSTMITLFSLSVKSEIVVMRSMGMSIWRIISPIVMMNFIIGLIFIFIFLPLTIASNTKYVEMEKRFVEEVKGESFDTPITILERKRSDLEKELAAKEAEENLEQNIEIVPIEEEEDESFSPMNGVWLKQSNMENEGEEIKIRANKVYKNNLRLGDVTLWFFDKDYTFYKKINAEEMYLIGDKWVLKSIVINDSKNINKELKAMTISTNLKQEFILQKIIDNFQDVRAFSIISLPKLIDNLEISGFSSRKFQVYFNLLLNYPLLFAAMSIIAVYFAINNIRNKNNITYILLGVVFGLFAYVGLNIVNALGASGALPIFMSTWLVTFIFLAIAILLIFKKESL